MIDLDNSKLIAKIKFSKNMIDRSSDNSKLVDNPQFKKEYQEVLDMFGFTYRVGNLENPLFNDVFFVKGEEICYHNLRYVEYLESKEFELYTNYHNGLGKDISETCTNLIELKEILTRRFPMEARDLKLKLLGIDNV